MKASIFDGISRNLGDGSTRRGFFRLLGGAAAAGAIGAAGLGGQSEPAAAKRKRKKRSCKLIKCKAGFRCVKGRCRPDDNPGGGGGEDVCRPGKVVAQLTVGGNGAIVRTPVLTKGQAYIFQASGAAALSSLFSFDAEYIFSNTDASTGTDVDSGIDAGLSIDDPTADNDKSPKWGPYNPDHIYETQYIGKGQPAELRMHDGDYTDNSGSVLVTITCA